MSAIDKKVDFAVIFTVKNANPNGDPLNGNRPRVDVTGYGEMSDVSIKRKIRNRLMEMNQKIFVQSNDNVNDSFTNLRDRAESVIKGAKDQDDLIEKVCAEWFDVRAFGQLFAYKKDKKGDGVSVGIRGPVSVHPAFSISPVSISSIQITKSVNSEPTIGDKKSSDTMGMKYRVDGGTYILYGSINPQLAKKTGFSAEDAALLKEALCTLFWNDASAARPEGSMDVKKVFWWQHNNANGQHSSAKVHGSIKLVPKKGVTDPIFYEDYDIVETRLADLKPEVIEPR